MTARFCLDIERIKEMVLEGESKVCVCVCGWEGASKWQMSGSLKQRSAFKLLEVLEKSQLKNK